MKKLQFLFSATFWVYHAIYLFAFVFFVPIIIEPVQRGYTTRIELLTLGGDLPFNFVVMVYIFFLLPLFTFVFSLATKLYKTPKKQLMVFFGVEIPLMGIALIRIVLFREVTTAMWIFILSIVCSIVGLLLYIFAPDMKTKAKRLALLFSQEVALLIAAYVFLLAFFFLPIILALFIKMLQIIDIGRFFSGLFDPFFSGNILNGFFYLFLTFLFYSTIFAFVISPIAGLIVYWTTYKNLYHDAKQRFGKRYSLFSQVLFGVAYIALVLLVSLQTNIFWYTNDLDTFKKAKTFEQQKEIAQKLYSKDNTIKQSLVKAYLAQYRYLSDEKMNLLAFGYKNELQTSDQTAKNIQKLFNSVARPFVYAGQFEEDVKKAAQDYQELFDSSIQIGEKTAIINALNATNTNDTLKAGLLDRENTSVKLVTRHIQAEPLGERLFAKVTIEEEYENVTKRQQEVYYEFFLPEDAVLTELVLGPDLQFGSLASVATPTPTQEALQSIAGHSATITPAQKVDTATVAPRGAAQLTYDDQVIQRIDPALLEQTGPRQYKLRVFPIPAKGFTFDWRKIDYTKGEKDIRQKVRFSYVTMRTKDGIPLPVITDKRNVFSDSTTKITTLLSGKEVVPTKDTNAIPLSPDSLCLTEKIEEQTSLGTVTFIPQCDAQITNTEKKIQGKKIALLLDASYSSKQNNWQEFIQKQFPIEQLITDNTVDVYYFTNLVSQKQHLTKELLARGIETLHFGKTDRTNAILSIKEPYDVVFMITDSSTFDTKHKDIQVPKTPFYVIHPKNIPSYTEGFTSLLLQGNGKVFGNGHDALEHYWLTNRLKEQKQQAISINSFGTWMLVNENPGSANASPLGQLATQQLLYYKISQTPTLNLAFLDDMQNISRQSSIVSPYASMIVLVTEQQKRDLAEALKLNNRFTSDLIFNDDALLNPSGSRMMQVSAVPEPHEWALLCTGTFLLFVLYRKRMYEKIFPH